MPILLLLAASPLDQDRLRLGAELRDIRNALQRSKNREEWKIESNEASTVDDLRRALLDFKPTMVHFSGHGAGAEGICFENGEGDTNMVNASQLANLLRHFKDTVKCLVLNACYTQAQGHVLTQEIDYVVGMKKAVEDASATKFSVAFYDAIFAGATFRMAFDLGCSALDLNKLPDADVPVLMTGGHLTATVLHYTAMIPDIERVLDDYFNTPFSERAKYTTSGEKIRASIIKYYGENFHRKRQKTHVLSISPIGLEYWRVEVRSGECREMYLRVRERNVLIEWEASVGLWSIPVKTYLALGSSYPVVARVKAHLDNYYNFDFSNAKDRYQSINLEAVGYEHESLHAYVDRRSPIFQPLMEILEDGNEHAITLEIENRTSQSNQPIISRILSNTWIYHQDNLMS